MQVKLQTLVRSNIGNDVVIYKVSVVRKMQRTIQGMEDIQSYKVTIFLQKGTKNQ